MPPPATARLKKIGLVTRLFSSKKKSLVQIDKPDYGPSASTAEPPKPEAVAAQGTAAASEARQAAPPPTAAEAPAPSVPPAETPAIDNEEETYELQVPPNTKPGSKLKLTIPGIPDKVVITVPPGALPGNVISFSMPKSKEAVQAKLLEQAKAVTRLQSRLRGKQAREVTRKQIEAAQAAAPAAEAEYAPNFAPTPGAPAEPVTAAAAATPSPLPPPPPPPPLVIKGEEPGWGLHRFLGSLFGSVLREPPPPEPAVEAPSAAAFELSSLAARAIAAWDATDFDTFAALADQGIVASLPHVSAASGLTAVWAARESDEAHGQLSIDSVMVQVDHEGASATLVAMQHAHAVDSDGMPVAHCWLRMVFKQAATHDAGAVSAASGAAAPARAWKLTELTRQPIWPLPAAGSQAPAAGAPGKPPPGMPPPPGMLPSPVANRLGNGRTLGGCTDAASLSAVALTSWISGDQIRFEAAVAPEVTMTFKALGLEASGVHASWQGRSSLLPIGTLIAVNSPMVVSNGRETTSVLAHAHLYDVTSAVSSGRPTAHFALRLEFTGLRLQSVVGDAIWIAEDLSPSEYETAGLAFDNPSVQSTYTRALTFVKAWETHVEESLRALASPSVRLEVPRSQIEGADIEALLAYRATLGTLGMLTVDSVRVSPARFEAFLHAADALHASAHHGAPLPTGARVAGQIRSVPTRIRRRGGAAWAPAHARGLRARLCPRRRVPGDEGVPHES